MAPQIDHTLVFDIGKTNKKVLVYDAALEVVHEASTQLAEATDDDGFPCEDLPALTAWMDAQLAQVRSAYPITHLNVSTYGASLVYVDAEGQPVAPLYNYLKPIDTGFLRKLYRAHGGPQHFHAVTGSPPLGALNSGFQLAWFREADPAAFAKTHHALHLPNYLSYRYTGRAVADYTSIGCHTALWDMTRGRYHDWLGAGALRERLPEAAPAHGLTPGRGSAEGLQVGTGIHDSSAALVPYLRSSTEPFVLLSTGTWSIAFAPDNATPLTTYELSRDCLNFLRTDGTPVKASRLFLGREHDLQCAVLAEHFGVELGFYEMVPYVERQDPRGERAQFVWQVLSGEYVGDVQLSAQGKTRLTDATYALAYHRLMRELVDLQIEQLRLLVDDDDLRTLHIDGGFADNPLFTAMLAAHYPRARVLPARHAQGTALGAALALRS